MRSSITTIGDVERRRCRVSVNASHVGEHREADTFDEGKVVINIVDIHLLH